MWNEGRHPIIVLETEIQKGQSAGKFVNRYAQGEIARNKCLRKKRHRREAEGRLLKGQGLFCQQVKAEIGINEVRPTGGEINRNEQAERLGVRDVE